MDMSETISIIGLGKLGSCMAAGIAQMGHNVIGMDVNTELVEIINSGKSPYLEPELARLIACNRNRLNATSNCAMAVANSSQSFVIVPTPSAGDGSFSLKYATVAFQAIGNALAKKSSYHNVVLTSTVLPGSIIYGLLPILERTSGKTCGRDFGLCYSPLFIALGSVIKNFLNPDFTLIGEYDERSGDFLETFYRSVLQNDSPYKRMSIVNAEITKIALNTFITSKLTFANMVSDICQNLPGGDVDVVTDALGTDSRIGSKYLKSGLGYGGPCFPRDNQALSFIAGEIGTFADLAVITDKMNRQRPSWLFDSYIDKLAPGSTVAVLGLAYNPATPVLDESQSIMLCNLLQDAGFKVVAYDPLVTRHALFLPPGLLVAETLTDCLVEAQAIFITTIDQQFADIESHLAVSTVIRPIVVIDCWRMFKNQFAGKPGIIYLAPGLACSDHAFEKKLRETWGNRLQSELSVIDIKQ